MHDVNSEQAELESLRFEVAYLRDLVSPAKQLHPLAQYSNAELAGRMRAHVIKRNGLSRDEDGNLAIPNGAWAMLMEAAARLDNTGTDGCGE